VKCGIEDEMTDNAAKTDNAAPFNILLIVWG
jgi:hypothetical protein